MPIYIPNSWPITLNGITYFYTLASLFGILLLVQRLWLVWFQIKRTENMNFLWYIQINWIEYLAEKSSQDSSHSANVKMIYKILETRFVISVLIRWIFQYTFNYMLTITIYVQIHVHVIHKYININIIFIKLCFIIRCHIHMLYTINIIHTKPLDYYFIWVSPLGSAESWLECYSN